MSDSARKRDGGAYSNSSQMTASHPATITSSPQQGFREALLNLSVEPIVVRCEATSVNADGYPPSNLISNDLAARARGFQLEHFVRPPVTVEMWLSRRVRVAFLFLHVQLPQGAECRLEVFGSPGGQNSYSHCAGVTLSGCEVLLLRNRSYGRQIGEEVPSVTEVRGSYLPADLTHQSRMEQPFKACSTLNVLRRLKVSVSWLSGHLPLRLKAMEMWGTPCGSDASRDLARLHPCADADSRVVSVYNSTSPPLEEVSGPLLSGAQTISGTRNVPHGSNPHLCTSKVSRLLSGEEEGEEEEGSSCFDPKGHRGSPSRLGAVALQHEAGDKPGTGTGTGAQSTASIATPPSKLLDEITCDVMHVPVLLPSGHYVDQSTIDKLEHMDLLYGRSPCDPFTGVPFSTTSRPMFSAELKCQLDAFLSTNESPPCMTVGGGKEIHSHLELAGVQVKRQANDMRPLKPSKRLRADFDDLGTKFDPVPMPGLPPSDPVLNTPDHNAATSEGAQSQPSRKCGHTQQDHHEAEVASSLVLALGLLYNTQPHCSTPERRT